MIALRTIPPDIAIVAIAVALLVGVLVMVATRPAYPVRRALVLLPTRLPLIAAVRRLIALGRVGIFSS